MDPKTTQKTPKKPSISGKDWEQLKSDADAASQILKGDQYLFLRDYLDRARNSVLQSFARQSIEDVTVEEVDISGNKIRKVFHPAKKEYTHLAGQFKFIEQLLADLATIADLPQQALNDQKRGAVIIETTKEDEG